MGLCTTKLQYDSLQQIHELVEYIARSKPEADRVAFKQPFADSLKTENDQYSDSVPSEKKQEIVQQALGAVDGLGDGSDRGLCMAHWQNSD